MKLQKNLTYRLDPGLFENDTFFFIEMTSEGGAYFHRIIDGLDGGTREAINWSYFTPAELKEGILKPLYAQKPLDADKLKGLIDNASAATHLMDSTDFEHHMYAERAQLEQDAWDDLTGYCFSLMPVKWQKKVYNTNYELWRAKVIDKYILA